MGNHRSGSQVGLLIMSVIAVIGGLAAILLPLGTHFLPDTITPIVGADVAGFFDNVWTFRLAEGVILFLMGCAGLIASRSARKAFPCLILSIAWLVVAYLAEVQAGNNVIEMFTSGNILVHVIIILVFALVYDGFACTVRAQGKRH